MVQRRQWGSKRSWPKVAGAVALCLVITPLAALQSTRSGKTPPGVVNPRFVAENTFGRAASPGIVRITEETFLPGSPLVGFNELPLNTLNPVFPPGDYGGDPFEPVVSSGGFFLGQALGNADTCPPGAPLSGCVVGNPSNPLQLDGLSPGAFITADGAQPKSPVLSGTPLFNGAIAIFFSEDVAGVGLRGGNFDAAASTAISAYSRDGSLLGAISNIGEGLEFLGVMTADGADDIAGILVSLVGREQLGFTVDELRFGTSAQLAAAPTGKPQLSVRGGFIKLETTGGLAPQASDCSDPANHYGRLVLDEAAPALYVCTQSGWVNFNP